MASLGSFQRQLFRVRANKIFNSCSLHSGSALCIHSTNVVQKAKSSLSSAVVNRKRKKLDKAMRMIQQKGVRIKKPIEEYEVSVPLKRDILAGIRQRERTVYSSEELESQVLLEKDWARYKIKQHLRELHACGRMAATQEKALNKLREESEELYQMAIQCDNTLFPYTFKGPLYTPPKTEYYAADGNYIDKTEYFQEEIGLFTENLLPKIYKPKKKEPV